MQNEKMRVKIFHAENGDICDLEEAVNKWLSEQDKIHIVNMKQTESMCAYKQRIEYTQIWNMTITVWYHPIDKEKGSNPRKVK